MAQLLKSFGKGLLYLLVLPLLIVILAVLSVVGIFIFIFVGIKAVILYFTGRNIFGDLPEDIKAREILEAQNPSKQEVPQIQNQGEVNQVPTAFTTYFSPIEPTTPATSEVKQEETKIEEAKPNIDEGGNE